MDTIRTGRLELVPLTGPFIEAVRGGNLAAAEREIGAGVSRWLTIDSTHLVQLNLAQRTADAVGLETPGWAMWNRSPRTTLASRRSVSAGRDAITVKPRSRAAATAAIQSVDFPIPAAPSMTNARGPAADRSRNASMAEDSASRPTIAPITP